MFARTRSARACLSCTHRWAHVPHCPQPRRSEDSEPDARGTAKAAPRTRSPRRAHDFLTPEPAPASWKPQHASAKHGPHEQRSQNCLASNALPRLQHRSQPLTAIGSLDYHVVSERASSSHPLLVSPIPSSPPPRWRSASLGWRCKILVSSRCGSSVRWCGRPRRRSNVLHHEAGPD